MEKREVFVAIEDLEPLIFDVFKLSEIVGTEIYTVQDLTILQQAEFHLAELALLVARISTNPKSYQKAKQFFNSKKKKKRGFGS